MCPSYDLHPLCLSASWLGPHKAPVTLTDSFVTLKIIELDSTVVYNKENLDLTDMSKSMLLIQNYGTSIQKNIYATIEVTL